MNTTYSYGYVATDSHITWNSRTIFTLIICIALPLIMGAVSAFLTQNAMFSFESMNKPPLAPPAWLFPIAWTILYILMGGASFFIYESSDESHYIGLAIYAFQLIFNFVWSLIFFRLGDYVLSTVWLVLLISLIIALIANTSKYSIIAMSMLIPYAAWCCFALYLNIGIAMNN